MSDVRTTSSGCGEPLSWLRLEQYALGELPRDQHRAIDQHLQGCEVCRGCLEQIHDDPYELPTLDPRPTAAADPGRRPLLSWPRLLWGCAAAAAAIVLLLIVHPRRPDLPDPRSTISFKGGELTFALVRERGGVIEHDPSTFTVSDRFKVLVTCVPGQRWAGDLLVSQGDDIDFPLPPANALACGNRVPLERAFRLTGDERATICLVVGQKTMPPDRQWLRRRFARGGARALPAEHTVCVQLRPASL